MPVFRVTGKLWPAEKFSLNYNPKYDVYPKEFGPSEVEVFIKNDEINVVFRTNSEAALNYLSVVYFIALNQVMGIMNTITLSSGRAFKILLDRIVINEKDEVLMGSGYNGFRPAFAKLFKDKFRIQMVIHLLNRDSNSFAVVNHLINATTVPHSAIISCALAVETARNAIHPERKKMNIAWAAMREKLNFSEEYLSKIVKFSGAARHGDFSDVSHTEIHPIIDLTCVVVERYIEYKLRGSSDSLPIDEFPIL